MSALESQEFDKRNDFVGERMKTCNYRFYKILQARRLEVPKLSNSFDNSEVQREVRQTILNRVDQYVNCIIKHHRGGQIPQNIQPAVMNFKSHVYSKLSPQYILQDQRLKLVRTIYDAFATK